MLQSSGLFLPVLAALLTGVAMSSVGTAAAQGDNVSSDLVTATSNQALRSIKAAEASGADVRALIDRFNMAIDLQHQAENGVYESCSSHYECISQSNTIMLSIVEDAAILGNESTARIEQANVTTFSVYIPLGSFALALVVVTVYGAWASRRSNRYQKMDVHQRKGH